MSILRLMLGLGQLVGLVCVVASLVLAFVEFVRASLRVRPPDPEPTLSTQLLLWGAGLLVLSLAL